MELKRRTKQVLRYPFLLAGCMVLGTVCHEVVGHGLVGVACGGKIDQVEVLGVQLYPSPKWLGWQGYYGHCLVTGVDTTTGSHLVSLGGSMSTWCVSVAAITLLWLRRWGPWPRTVLACLGIWWIDLLTYTLPSWGVPRSVLWGQDYYSEPYEAAVALGMPGPIFQASALVTCVILAGALVLRLIHYRPARCAQGPADRSR
ncbi:MAG: hypothetical protein JXQ75_12125 [Phycisphaerae bacterium]|nr:hypothetical protein [Phycisphaerae bacterium]